MSDDSGWIGVDFDCTLATAYPGHGDELGSPVPEMVKRVKKWLEEGEDVRLFTARADFPKQFPALRRWMKSHLGEALPITNIKDYHMKELWDDRAIQVVPNTGKPVGDRK